MTPTGDEADRYIHDKLARLPPAFRDRVYWLLRPGSRWLRWPVGLLFIFGGFMWFLPVLGFWMLPLGLFLIAEDVPSVKRWLVGVAMSGEERWRRWRS